MKKNVRHDVGKRIHSVSLMPSFMLGIQGRLDSRKGESTIPDARIEGMKNKCMAIEKREALIIESRYEPVRKEGLRAVSMIAAYKKADISVPQADEAVSAVDIRNRTRLDRKRGDAEQAVMRLFDIRESLIHADTVLCERIRRTREKALNVKIASYVKGVRSGGMPEYSPCLELRDDAYRIYIDKHIKSDELIFNTAETLSQEVI